MKFSLTLALTSGCVIAAAQRYLDVGWWIWVLFSFALLMDLAASQKHQKPPSTGPSSTLLGYSRKRDVM